MNFFAGQFKSRPNINLAGSSNVKSREALINEAINERKKREFEKKQQISATKIQSLYRSYIIRKRLRDDYRAKFQHLFSAQQQHSDTEIRALISYFVVFFDVRLDLVYLASFSQFVIKNKERIVKILIEDVSNTKFSLCKFLGIHLNLLNQKGFKTEVSHSVSLRLIDYFTDPLTYSKLKYDESQYEPELALILKFLINQGYIKNLIEYGVSKIPKGCRNEIQAPLIYSIGHLINRTFLFFNFGLKLTENKTDDSELIINKLCSQFFVKCQSDPQVKTILLKMSQIIVEEARKEKNNTTSSAKNNQIENLVEFIRLIRCLLVKNTFASFSHENFMSLLYSVLTLTLPLLEEFNNDSFILFVNVLQLLIVKVLTLDLNFETKSFDSGLVNDDADENQMQIDNIDECNNPLKTEIFDLLDSKTFSNRLESIFLSFQRFNDDKGYCFSTSYIFYFMLKIAKLKIHESNMLRKVAFNKFYLYSLWKNICTLKTGDETKNQLYYLQVLASGNLAKLNQEDLYKIVAPLSTFSSLYNLFLLPILDDEFLNEKAIFSKIELIKMSSNLKDVCLGIIQLMHPDTATPQTGSSASNYIDESDMYKNLHKRLNSSNNQSKKDASFMRLRKQAACFTLLFQQCAQLVQRLYTRDIRTGFCSSDHWLAKSFKLVSLHRLSDLIQTYEPAILTNIRFGQASYLFQQQDDFFMQQENKLNVNDIRSLTILQELPFTVVFKDRIQILETFMKQYEQQRYSPSEQTVRLRIRRDFMYEDAFENLSLENCPNLKSSRMVVEMINQHGLDEAGIDGGGVFREFIINLLETSFDPTRGFFVLTSDGFLYPNPNIEFLVHNYEEHYFFLGRLLGKAIQCKILSSLKFAMFFLQKILISKSVSMDTRLDVDYLVSLDSQIYKNLLYLKDSERIEDLELNFAINTADFGETKLTELKPGGADIYVNDDNKIEYIHLVADFKLNKQINRQVISFRNGLSNIIDLELLRLFNFNEFQYLVSGSDEVIDVNDWKNYTVYAGAYSTQSPVIINFWKVVTSFSDEQRRKLLKFVTSRSRTPLFGFKNLIPNFAIHSSGSEMRLPTASTCMNLLKLPPIEDFELLKDKLLCAIESDSGFELS